MAVNDDYVNLRRSKLGTLRAEGIGRGGEPSRGRQAPVTAEAGALERATSAQGGAGEPTRARGGGGSQRIRGAARPRRGVVACDSNFMARGDESAQISITWPRRNQHYERQGSAHRQRHGVEPMAEGRRASKSFSIASRSNRIRSRALHNQHSSSPRQAFFPARTWP